MEQNENYKTICDLIAQFENQLRSIDFIEQEQDFNLMRRRIEEHFERYIHALEARRDLLLDQLDELALQHWEKTEEIENQLKQYVKDCTNICTTGSKLYSKRADSADHIWQGALSLPKPTVSIDEIKVDITITLPDNLGNIIDCHGTINIPATNQIQIEKCKEALDLPKCSSSIDENKVDDAITSPDNLEHIIDSHNAVNIHATYPPIEQDSVTTACVPASISSNVNFERFTVADRVSTIAGEFSGYADGTGPNAMFKYPRGICFNPNDDCFYVCDTSNDAIRRVTLNGSVSTLVQATKNFFESKNFFEPLIIVVCVKENCLFVSCKGDECKIIKISMKDMCYKHKKINIIAKILFLGEIIPFVANTKRNKDGNNFNPLGIAIEYHSGNLFVVDCDAHVIKLITPQGKVSTFAGSTKGFADGHSTKAQFNHPHSLCIDVVDQSLLVCDFGNNKIRRISHIGDVSTVCTITNPRCVAITANGVIFVSSMDHKIYKVTKQKTGAYEAEVIVGTIDRKVSECKFSFPQGIVIHEPSHSCYIVDFHSIKKIDFL